MNKIKLRGLIFLVFIIGFQAGLLLAFLVKPPAPNFDLLAFTETAMGLMVAFLAIVGAFIVAYIWSDFDSILKNRIKKAEAIGDVALRLAIEAAEGKLNGKEDELRIYFLEELEKIEQRLKAVEEKKQLNSAKKVISSQ